MTATVGLNDKNARERLEAACNALAEIAAADAAGSKVVWAARLEKAARSLERALKRHRKASEAKDGTLDELVAAKPGLAETVEAQAQQHMDLLRRVETLALDGEKAVAFDDPNVALLALDAQIMTLMVRRHLTWESILLYEAFFREEGGQA